MGILDPRNVDRFLQVCVKDVFYIELGTFFWKALVHQKCKALCKIPNMCAFLHIGTADYYKKLTTVTENMGNIGQT